MIISFRAKINENSVLRRYDKDLEWIVVKLNKQLDHLPSIAELDGYKNDVVSQLKDANDAEFYEIEKVTYIDDGKPAAPAVVSTSPNTGRLTLDRAKQLLFQTIELLRNTSNMSSSDLKDRDDWLFSEIDAEVGEIEDVYAPYKQSALISLDSCFDDGESPKNFDRVYFEMKK